MRTNYPTREIGRPMDTESIKRNAFHDQQIAVIDLKSPNLSWVDKAEVERVAAKIYGPRQKRSA